MSMKRARLAHINGVEVLRVDDGAQDYILYNGVLCSVNGSYFNEALRRKAGPREWCRWTVRPSTNVPTDEMKMSPDYVAFTYFINEGLTVLDPNSRAGRLALDDALLRTEVIVSNNNALANGYDLDGWDAEQIASDIREHDTDLEHVSVRDLLPHVREWQLIRRTPGVNCIGSVFQGIDDDHCGTCSKPKDAHLTVEGRAYCPIYFDESDVPTYVDNAVTHSKPEEPPSILTCTIFAIQVCVPFTWSDDEVEAYVKDLTKSGWRVRREGPDPKEVQCEKHVKMKHVVLDEGGLTDG